MKEKLLNSERWDEVGQIEQLEHELKNILGWLRPIIPHYSNFTKAANQPWKEGSWEAKTKLQNNFPNVTSPFKSSQFITPEVNRRFANFCQRNNIKCDLNGFINQLEDFISHKGTGPTGAILIYSETDKLLAALKKFKIWITNPRQLTIP